MTKVAAAPNVPARPDLAELASAVQVCRGCDLYLTARQAVFGSGPSRARLVLVGEQPGDVEDREGKPFVGPAGRVLDEALASAEIDRAQVYVTNAVKHFRFKSTASGKRRLHERPSVRHIEACQPWLSAELAVVSPRGVVALGAVAVRTLLGPAFRVTRGRGRVLNWPPDAGPYVGSDLPISFVVATIHPSAVLRGRPEDRKAMLAGLVDDLRLAARTLGSPT